jgi:hypothetical protein
MFDVMTSVEDTESGEFDDNLLKSYIDAITVEFSESPEFLELSDKSHIDYVVFYLEYAASYVGETVGTMTLACSNEVLFDIFPRKVTMDASEASTVICEIRAFWKFIDRTRNLPVAARIVAELDEDAETELEELLGDESNFGMAKSFFAMGKKHGFDMNSESGMNQFMAFYNSNLVNRQAPPSRESFDDDDVLDQRYEHPETIRHDEPKVGRNDPCSCGSGKKYKKCCGKNG